MKLITKSKKISAVAVITIILIVIFFIFPDICRDSVKSSLLFSASSVIPSLFPFTVLSSVLINIPYEKEKSKNASIVKAFILGHLCGFPVGAMGVSSLAENGIISKKEAPYYAFLCSGCSLAFAESFLGIGLFSSARVGFILYITELLSAVFVFAVFKLLFKGDKPKTASAKQQIYRKTSAISLFVNAITGSASICLTAAGFITFFSVLSNCFIEIFKPGLTVAAIITSIFEISGGLMASASLPALTAITICAFALGFSGLSALLQCSVSLSKAEIPLLPFFSLKVIQGIICASVTYYLFRLNPPVPVIKSSGCGFASIPGTIVCISLLLVLAIIGYFNNNRPNT